MITIHPMGNLIAWQSFQFLVRHFIQSPKCELCGDARGKVRHQSLWESD